MMVFRWQGRDMFASQIERLRRMRSFQAFCLRGTIVSLVASHRRRRSQQCVVHMWTVEDVERTSKPEGLGSKRTVQPVLGALYDQNC